MRHVLHTTWSLAVGTVIGLGLCLSVIDAGATDMEPSVLGPARSNATAPATVPLGTERMEGPDPALSMLSQAGLHMRMVPTLSKQLSVGGTLVEPYVGAGFGNGYATDLDRLHARESSAGPFDPGLRSLFGWSPIPNEVQLGIRLPF